MKRICAILFCAVALFVLAGCTSCKGEGQSQSLFTFLSVRMKGNGDGTITAVAQNELSLLPAVLPVTLTLYFASDMETDTSEMTRLKSVESDDLNIFQSLEIVWEVQDEGYFLAEISFSLNGETRYIKSDTIHYDTYGNRTD